MNLVLPQKTPDARVGEIIKLAVMAVGGQGGGGRPDMAQAGGPDGVNAQAVLDAIEAAIGEAS